MLTFGLAAITLLKGKIWTGLFGLFLFPLLIVGAIRLARPGSPWARWRYQNQPHKRARAARRERRWRQPVVRFRVRLEDFVSGLQDRPDPPPLSQPARPTWNAKSATARTSWYPTATAWVWVTWAASRPRHRSVCTTMTVRPVCSGRDTAVTTPSAHRAGTPSS